MDLCIRSSHQYLAHLSFHFLCGGSLTICSKSRVFLDSLVSKIGEYKKEIGVRLYNSHILLSHSNLIVCPVLEVSRSSRRIVAIYRA